MTATVCPFPLSQVRDWREESRRQAEINRIDAQIQANEQEIARLGHKNWLLRLEKEGLSNER